MSYSGSTIYTLASVRSANVVKIIIDDSFYNCFSLFVARYKLVPPLLPFMALYNQIIAMEKWLNNNFTINNLTAKTVCAANESQNTFLNNRLDPGGKKHRETSTYFKGVRPSSLLESLNSIRELDENSQLYIWCKKIDKKSEINALGLYLHYPSDKRTLNMFWIGLKNHVEAHIKTLEMSSLDFSKFSSDYASWLEEAKKANN